jgi:RNA polymerase sigma factor (sigma-70 family)
MAARTSRYLFGQRGSPETASDSSHLSDGELLERFVSTQDEAAFEMLVWRHGPLVMGVCRRVLSNEHDAEEAFQATFLILARKAATIGRGESVGAWLYKVASRAALRARGLRGRRQGREQPLDEQLVEEKGPSSEDDLAWSELAPLLDAEVNRLPEKYRKVFVLCYLEGKTNEAAARQLGCPKGTVLSRLARARDRLRRRLQLRGLAFDAGALATLLAVHARPLIDLSPVLVTTTVHLAILWHFACLALGKAASAAVALAESTLFEMKIRQWGRNLLAALVLLLVGGLGLAGGNSVSEFLAPSPGSVTAPTEDCPPDQRPPERALPGFPP